MGAIGGVANARRSGYREGDALEALAQRLTAAAAVLDIRSTEEEGAAPARVAASLLTCLARRLFDSPDPASTWLTVSALAAAYPDQAELEWLWRRMALCHDPTEVLEALLSCSGAVCTRAGNPLARIHVAQDTVLLNVEECGSARADPDTRLLGSALRTALADECLEVGWGDWCAGFELPAGVVDQNQAAPTRPSFVVPWRCAIAVVGTPPPSACAPLAALAAHSGNDLILVGPDLAAVANADLIPLDDVERGIDYINVVKHAQTVIATSDIAGEQVRGLQRMLATQGLPGPAVLTVALPGFDSAALVFPERQLPERHPSTGDHAAGGSRVMVLGHPGAGGGVDVALAAARRLWRSGSPLLLHIPAGDWQPEQRERVAAAAGVDHKRITIDPHLRPDELTRVRSPARCCICVPSADAALAVVSDVLQAGIPVLTSSVGSLSEATGAVHVNCRDVDLIASALQALLDESPFVGPSARTWNSWGADVAAIVRAVCAGD